MELEFENKKLEKHCQNEKELQKKYGNVQAEIIIRRLNELQAAVNLYDVFKLPWTRLHPLLGDRQGELSVDLKHSNRLVIIPMNGDPRHWETVTKVKIIEIVDYH